MAYPQAVNYFMDLLESEDQAKVTFKYTHAVSIYESLNKMYESIQRSPGAQQVIRHPKKYYQTFNQLLPLAAEEQYQAGLAQLNYSNRENAKQAYYYFLKSDELVKGYKEVAQKIDEAYQKSILHVIADLKPVQSRRYELSADVFYRRVNNSLQQIENNEFIVFYTPQEARDLNLQYPDQILEINFEDFVVGESHTKERIEKMTKDSVVVGSISLDEGRKKEIIGTVEAEVSLYRMEVRSRGLVNLTITKPGIQAKDIISEDFPGEFVWFNEWGSFNGDKRALAKEQISLCANKRVNPLPPQQMFG